MSRPPSSRVTTWPLLTDADRERWDVWAAALAAARHPSLARVEEVSRTEDVGTLALADPDSESVTEWAARTGAPVPERLAVLRAAASALDALYAGAESVSGIPHGAICAEVVRVASDGSTRLVGFSPWTSLDAVRYRAPELVPDAPATRAGDAFAFARLVADVLGGPRAAEASGASEMSQALRSSPDTRRRVRLIKAVTAVLTEPPEARPHLLTSWLAAAVEGTAATEVSGLVRQPDATSPPPGTAPRAPRRRWGLAAAAVLGIAVAAWAFHDRGADPVGTTVKDGTAASGTPFLRSAVWAPACGEGSGIAGVGDVEALRTMTTAEELDALPEQVAVGRWHQGRALITLSVPEGAEQPITVTGVEARRITRAGPPSWIARPATGCDPGPEPDQIYVADLEKTGAATVSTVGARPRFTSKGNFTLSADPVVVALDVTACRTNVDWQPVVHYTSGSESRELRLDTVFTTYGRAAGADQYRLDEGKSEPQRLGPVSEADPTC